MYANWRLSVTWSAPLWKHKEQKEIRYIPVCLFSFQSVKYTLLDDAASHCNAAAAPAAATPKTLFYTLHNH